MCSDYTGGEDSIVIVLWASSVVSGVGCGPYDWGVFVGLYLFHNCKVTERPFDNILSISAEPGLPPFLGPWPFPRMPAGIGETNQNSMEGDSAALAAFEPQTKSLITRAILLAGNNLLWVQALGTSWNYVENFILPSENR